MYINFNRSYSFSFIYDEIIIESSFHLTHLRDFFNYDITILFRLDNELLDYKNKVIIENKKYNEDELYKLFNITDAELNTII